MNALLKDGNSMVDFEVSKGSHVFFRYGNEEGTSVTERFIEWEDLTEDAKERCLQVQERVNGAFEEARRDLNGVRLLNGVKPLSGIVI